MMTLENMVILRYYKDGEFTITTKEDASGFTASLFHSKIKEKSIPNVYTRLRGLGKYESADYSAFMMLYELELPELKEEYLKANGN